MNSVPPGMPPGGAPYPPPPGYGQPPSYPPPYPPPYAPQPPPYAPQPPPKGNRGMLLGIGGGVVAAFVVLLVAFLLLRPRASTVAATATPGATVAAAATATAAATPTGAPTVAPTATTGGVIVDLATATRPPATPSVAPPTATATRAPTSATTPTRPPTTPTTPALTAWTDPDGFVSLKFPGGWKQGRDATNPSNLLELDGPDTYMAFNLEDPQQGTLTEEIDIIKRNQANSQKYNYTDQQTQDVTIGGAPARRMTYTYTDKADATKRYAGIWWVVNHEGRQYAILAGPVGGSRQEVDAVVASVTFPPARLSTWVDADRSVRLRHPKEWTASRDTSVKDNALLLSGFNGEIGIDVDIFAPGTVTIEQQFKMIRDGGSDDGKTTRTYDPVVNTTVGGQPAKSMAYRYTQKANPNLAPGLATIWIVDYKGKRYMFLASNMATRRPEIEAFMATVTFLK